MSENRVRYSSDWTVFAQDGLPLTFVLMAGAVGLLSTLGAEGIGTLFFLGALACGGLVFLLTSSLRHVEADDQFLYVIGRNDEVKVPLSIISGIVVRWSPIGGPVAHVVFASESAAGKGVVFLPARSGFLQAAISSVESLRLRAGFKGPWRRAA